MFHVVVKDTRNLIYATAKTRQHFELQKIYPLDSHIKVAIPSNAQIFILWSAEGKRLQVNRRQDSHYQKT